MVYLLFLNFTIGGTTVTPSVFTEDTDQTTTNTYVATYEVQAGKNGGVSFLFVGKDAAGNTSRAVTNTTDGSTITIDTTVHTFTTVSISSNNTNTSFAKQGDTITLTATASETLSDVPTFSSLTIGGNVDNISYSLEMTVTNQQQTHMSLLTMYKQEKMVQWLSYLLVRIQ